ncbi:MULTISPECIES: ubiquitin-like domain-containing protein [unclassified Buttiauxella]|uniref:ubiquitin-like domain-containing protein n=1 Tax=unclassified Buttiauxella TaxID=2634062 RepID=UPI001E2F1375|nr:MULTISPECIES: ubiquitin-like domain-containing protein [unclassified Buttiauxella]MCE0798948.1 hypothetical protein [Buttiauxella sp. W03-F01]MCE0811541.1 hypothetical protein [Buttiauxella sp. S04-F03]
MQINFVDENDSEFSLDVESADTILNVKSRIADNTGVSIDRIRLVYNGKVLDEGLTLGVYNIADGATINIV